MCEILGVQCELLINLENKTHGINSRALMVHDWLEVGWALRSVF
jgi:hypothetical protein